MSDEWDVEDEEKVEEKTSAQTTTISPKSSKSRLAEYLEDKDDEHRTKVLDRVIKYQLNPNDPMFEILTVLGSYQVLIEEAPAALALTLEKACEKFDQTSKTIIEAKAARSVESLLKKTENLQLSRPTKVLIPGLALFASVFCLGSIAGVLGTMGLEQFSSSGQKLLTLKDAALLDWVKSEEGKYAKNLYEWNKPYIQSGRCIQDMVSLNVKLTTGRSNAINGFCALFVVPPNQRQYQ